MLVHRSDTGSYVNPKKVVKNWDKKNQNNEEKKKKKKKKKKNVDDRYYQNKNLKFIT